MDQVVANYEIPADMFGGHLGGHIGFLNEATSLWNYKLYNWNP